MWGLRCLPHRTKGRSQCVALSLSLPPERHPCCRRWRSPPTCRRSAPPPDVRAGPARRFRRLVSARRYRHDQSERQQARPIIRYTPTCCPCSSRITFRTGGIFGVGVGYQFNNWFRADVTGEYRGNANFHGLTDVLPDTGAVQRRQRHLQRPASPNWVFLANAYVDLGTWWCITPFIGAGVGTSRNTISNFPDDGCRTDLPRRQLFRGSPLRRARRSGTSPGRCMPVSPTRSPRT